MQEYIRKLVLGLRRALSSKRRPNLVPETTITSEESTAVPSRPDKVEELPNGGIPEQEPTKPIGAETQDAMALETLKIEHVPSTYQVYAAFFRDVTNSDFLHAQLKVRNPEFDYALIDASSVISRHHLLSGVFNALIVILDGTLLSQTPHSEIVLSMSTNNNVPTPLSLLSCKANIGGTRSQTHIVDGASRRGKQKISSSSNWSSRRHPQKQTPRHSPQRKHQKPYGRTSPNRSRVGQFRYQTRR
jgi:hypothetical protein